MKVLWLLAAAASLAACHNRSEDQAGAAPERTDTTAVTKQVDPERTGPPGTAGRPGNATVTPDSVVADSVGIDSTGVRIDSTGASPSPSSIPQDTLGPANTDSARTDTSATAP
jgi:hypothetical protein